MRAQGDEAAAPGGAHDPPGRPRLGPARALALGRTAPLLRQGGGGPGHRHAEPGPGCCVNGRRPVSRWCRPTGKTRS